MTREGAGGPAPRDGWLALERGMALQRAGRHAEAVPLLRQAQGRLPMEAAPLLNLSTSLLALGDANGAIAVARKGRLRAPGRKEAQAMLGVAYLAGEMFEAAAECFRAATRMAPDWPEGWAQLGQAYYRKGELAAAKAALGTALRVAPGHVAAMGMLATVLRATGETQEAGALLREMLALHPQDAGARVNMAVELIREERPVEALGLLEGPAPDVPAQRQPWLLMRALALIRLGRLAEGRAVLATVGRLPPALQPLLHWREVLLAEAEGDADGVARAAAAMEHALGVSDGVVSEHRIMAQYDLARFWMARAEPDRAFALWGKAHRQLARFEPFSRAQFAEFVDASIALFDAARLRGGQRAGNEDGRPVFVVGMPRSGTTLVEQILAAHGAVHGAGERMALARCFWELGGGEKVAAVQRIAGLDAAALDGRAAGYLAELAALDPAAARIVDKMPGNFRYLGLMSLLLPGARVIECERDPRDIGFSIFGFRFSGVHGYAHDLADLGWYIGQQRRLMAHWRAVLPNPIARVRLEDWVADFDGTLRRLLGFLELPYDPACADFHLVDRQVRTASRQQVLEPVHARGLGRWRPYARQLAPLIAALEESGALPYPDGKAGDL